METLETFSILGGIMIAHPPCTYICNGGSNWLNRDHLKWREGYLVRFLMELVTHPKIAIENPIGVMVPMQETRSTVHPICLGMR